MDKKIVVSILICFLVLACLGCIDNKKVVTPSPDITPVELLPKDVEGITLVNTNPHLLATMIGAKEAARGNYVDENGTKLTFEIYKYKYASDAEKYVEGIRKDVLHIGNLEESEVIAFNSGQFLFVVWGHSSISVEKLAKATGYMGENQNV